MCRALVTGAGRRLGQAMAVHLARAGHDVAIHYASSEEGAGETLAEVEAAGQRGALLRADLLDDAQAGALVGRAADALGGPLTCLVNNASLFEYDSMGSADPARFERNVGSNLRAPLWLSQAFAGQVQAPDRDTRGEPVAQGLIVNMLDQRVRKLTPHFITYTLAKSALWTLTQTSARALAPRVRVNAIGPGPTLRGDDQTQEHFEAQRAATILQRGPDPEDICGALSYFLGARAVTGQLLCVDGGQHLGWETPDVTID